MRQGVRGRRVEAPQAGRALAGVGIVGKKGEEAGGQGKVAARAPGDWRSWAWTEPLPWRPSPLTRAEAHQGLRGGASWLREQLPPQRTGAGPLSTHQFPLSCTEASSRLVGGWW